MTWITYFRLSIYGLTLLVSFAMVGIVGHSISTAFEFQDFGYDFQMLAIATAVLSMLTMIPFLVVGVIRKEAWLTMNVVEIPVLVFLWTLWFALAILCTSWAPVLYPVGCPVRANPIVKTFCAEFFATEGLAFVAWIFLLAYIVTMIIVCLIGKSRGHAVWLVSADRPSYFGPSSVPSEPFSPQQMAQPLKQVSSYPQQSPMLQQQQYAVPQQTYAPQVQPQYTGHSYNTTSGYASTPSPPPSVPPGVGQV